MKMFAFLRLNTTPNNKNCNTKQQTYAILFTPARSPPMDIDDSLFIPFAIEKNSPPKWLIPLNFTIEGSFSSPSELSEPIISIPILLFATLLVCFFACALCHFALTGFWSSGRWGLSGGGTMLSNGRRVNSQLPNSILVRAELQNSWLVGFLH